MPTAIRADVITNIIRYQHALYDHAVAIGRCDWSRCSKPMVGQDRFSSLHTLILSRRTYYGRTADSSAFYGRAAVTIECRNGETSENSSFLLTDRRFFSRAKAFVPHRRVSYSPVGLHVFLRFLASRDSVPSKAHCVFRSLARHTVTPVGGRFEPPTPRPACLVPNNVIRIKTDSFRDRFVRRITCVF